MSHNIGLKKTITSHPGVKEKLEKSGEERALPLTKIVQWRDFIFLNQSFSTPISYMFMHKIVCTFKMYVLYNVFQKWKMYTSNHCNTK